jgi:branched-chain amino acid transport system permease protein
MGNNLYKWIIWIVVLIIVLLFPQFADIYYTNLFVAFAIFALYSVALNLLLGYTGLLSFGFAMFFGIGAYSTALALTHIEGFPLLPSVLIGGVVPALVAFILSPMLVRVSGTAFAMITLAFGQLTFVTALKWREVTGGEDGIGGYPIPPFNLPGVLSIDMTDPTNFYYFAVVVIGICLWLVWFFTKTPFGSIMVGIRDNADRINYMGFRLPHSKMVILVVSGGFAGIAGAFYALFQNLVSTVGVLDAFTSFVPLMMAYIGGVGSFIGPIIGSAIVHIIEDISVRHTDRVDLVNGVIFILVVLYAPMGVVGLFRAANTKWFTKSGNQRSTEKVS